MEAAQDILFGAFDRHNFGDLLFAHIVGALLPAGSHRFAGLAERDLRAEGGHAVAPLLQISRHWHGQPPNVLHAGGEILTCRAREAAVMLMAPDQAQAALIAGREPQSVAGMSDLVPYVADPGCFPGARLQFNAVGGVDLLGLSAAEQQEVVRKLRAARWLGVRDRVTQRALQSLGIASHLLPDCAVMAAALFGPRIAQHAAAGEPAQMVKTFSNGYAAVQFSAEFADDAMLAQLAGQLDRLAEQHRLGIVLFRAGAAPWHDAIEPYQRLSAKLCTPASLFTSLHLWEICSLISGSRLYCGSSMHGYIVAAAYARPRVCFTRSTHPETSKTGAYARTWDPDLPGCVPPGEIAMAAARMLATPPDALHTRARTLVAAYRAGFKELAASRI